MDDQKPNGRVYSILAQARDICEMRRGEIGGQWQLNDDMMGVMKPRFRNALLQAVVDEA